MRAFLCRYTLRFDNFLSHRADVHITLFMAPLAILGLALPWAKLHDTVGTSPLVWQVSSSDMRRKALSFTFVFPALLSLLVFGCGGAVDAPKILAV